MSDTKEFIVVLLMGMLIGASVFGVFTSGAQGASTIETACRERGLLIVDKNVYQCRMLIRDGVAQQ